MSNLIKLTSSKANRLHDVAIHAMTVASIENQQDATEQFVKSILQNFENGLESNISLLKNYNAKISVEHGRCKFTKLKDLSTIIAYKETVLKIITAAINQTGRSGHTERLSVLYNVIRNERIINTNVRNTIPSFNDLDRFSTYQRLIGITVLEGNDALYYSITNVMQERAIGLTFMWLVLCLVLGGIVAVLMVMTGSMWVAENPITFISALVFTCILTAVIAVPRISKLTLGFSQYLYVTNEGKVYFFKTRINATFNNKIIWDVFTTHVLNCAVDDAELFTDKTSLAVLESLNAELMAAKDTSTPVKIGDIVYNTKELLNYSVTSGMAKTTLSKLNELKSLL